MCAVWLVTVLVGVGVTTMQSPPAPACVIGAAEDDVELMLGQPEAHALAGGALRRRVSFWGRVDWLGGRHTRRVAFLFGRAETDKTSYKPFAATPPRLDALYDAFDLYPVAVPRRQIFVFLPLFT